MVSADWVFAAALVFIVACSLFFGPRIASARVAMQWGFDGRPNWSAPKWLALWGMVGLVLGVRLFIWWAATYAPRHVHGVETGIILMSLTVAASHFFVLRTAAAHSNGNN